MNYRGATRMIFEFTRRLIQSSGIKTLIGVLLCSAIMLLLLTPWSPELPAGGLDPSWAAVIEWGLLQKQAFGTDLIFTFGPLGFLYTPAYHPDLYSYLLVFWGAVGMLLGTFFGAYWSRAPWLVSLALVFALTIAVGQPSDAWLFMIPLAGALAAMDPARPSWRWLTYPLLALAIVAGLVKFTVVFAAVAVFFVADMVRFWQSRTFPHLSALFLAGSWVLFIMASGHWNWPIYVLSSLEVAAGYSGAMQTTGPWAEVAGSALIGLLIVIILMATPTGRVGWSEFATRLGVALSVGLIIFLMFKAGVVRHDGHILITAAGLVVLSVFSAWRAFCQGVNRLAKGLVFVTLIAAIYQLLGVPALHLQGPARLETLKQLQLDRPRETVAAAKDLMFGRVEPSLGEQREGAWDAIREKSPLPELNGSVDIYNWDQAIVLAHGLDYSPRPVFQSYSAYTPRLLELNARYLSADTAPDSILFAIQAINNRLPALDDGLSWPLLWSRYDPTRVIGSHLLLKRRTRSDRETVWGESRILTTSWDEAVTIETDESKPPCVWAEVQIETSLSGRLLTTAFKAPIVEMTLELADESSVRRRFIPSMGHTGFLMSPYVETTAALAGVCAEETMASRRTVKSIAFHVAEKDRPLFDDQIGIRMRSLQVVGEPEHPAEGLSYRWMLLGHQLLDRVVGTCSVPPQWQDEKIFAHPPCEILMPLLDTRELHIDFGIFDGAWNQGNTNGVRFEVRGLVDGKWAVLAMKDLRPTENTADRNGGTFDIMLPEGLEKLVLVTDTLGEGSWDWSYWGPILPIE